MLYAAEEVKDKLEPGRSIWAVEYAKNQNTHPTHHQQKTVPEKIVKLRN